MMRIEWEMLIIQSIQNLCGMTSNEAENLVASYHFFLKQEWTAGRSVAQATLDLIELDNGDKYRESQSCGQTR